VEVRVPQDYCGGVIDLLNLRKGELQDMGLEEGAGTNVIKYLVPTRGMLGLKSALLSATRGTAIIDSVFDSYQPRIAGEIQGRDKGSLLAFSDGTATTNGMEWKVPKIEAVSLSTLRMMCTKAVSCLIVHMYIHL
jgi:GTP-binding protein